LTPIADPKASSWNTDVKRKINRTAAALEN